MAGGPNAQHARRGKQETLIERNTLIWQMRLKNKTQREIADMFGITQQQVSAILTEMINDRKEEASDAVRQFEVGKLDELEAAMLAILRREHVTIQGGKLVRESTVDADGKELLGAPYLDDGPAMAAADRLLKIAQRRAALLGLDAPTKIEQTSYDYTINGVNPEDLR